MSKFTRRNFLKAGVAAAAAGTSLSYGSFAIGGSSKKVVIVGGGTAGISVAARLCKGWFNDTDVAIIEPSDKHYYQPLWTLVGGGAARKEQSERKEANVIPRHATWIREAALNSD